MAFKPHNIMSTTNNNSSKITHNKHRCTTPYCKGKQICGLNHIIDEVKEAMNDTGLLPEIQTIIHQYTPYGLNLNLLDSDMIDNTPRAIPKVPKYPDNPDIVYCTTNNCSVRGYCSKFHACDDDDYKITSADKEQARNRLLNSVFTVNTTYYGPYNPNKTAKALEMRKIQDKVFHESVIAKQAEREKRAIEAKCELPLEASKYIFSKDQEYVYRTNNKTEFMYIPQLGDIVDARDSWGFWWRSIIISDMNCSYQQPNAAKFIKNVHFLGFPFCCDEKINIAMQDRVHQSGSNTVGIRRIQQSFLKATWDYAEMKQHGYTDIPDFIKFDYKNHFSIQDRQVSFLYNAPIAKPLIITTCLVCYGDMKHDVFNLGDNMTCGNCIGSRLKEDKKMYIPINKVCDTCRHPASYTILDTDEYLRTKKEVYSNICAACIMEREKKNITPFNDQPIIFPEIDIKAQNLAHNLFAIPAFTINSKDEDDVINDEQFKNLIKCSRCNNLAYDKNGAQLFKPGFCGRCQNLRDQDPFAFNVPVKITAIKP